MIQEILNRTVINIIQSNTITRNILPIQSHLLQEKLMKSSSTEFLFSRSATIIIDTSIRNGHSTRFYDNLNNVFTIYRKMIGFRKYTCIVDNLVWNIFQLFMKIVNANHSQVVINANINLSPLSVSEAQIPTSGTRLSIYAYAQRFDFHDSCYKINESS